MFDNFSINKHKYLKYSKSGSMHQLREIIELSRKPLDRNFAEKYNDISQVFENIFNILYHCSLCKIIFNYKLRLFSFIVKWKLNTFKFIK